jgi:hypothetical protein
VRHICERSLKALEEKKMKTRNIKIITTIFALALISATQVFADQSFSDKDEKDTKVFTVKAPIIRILTETLTIDESDLAFLEEKLGDLRTIKFSIGENVAIVVEDDSPDFYFNTESWVANQLEEWMFEDLTPIEEESAMEEWMFSDEYLVGEGEQGIENWMLTDDYFTSEYENSTIETWMLEDDFYESNDTPLVFEDWMFNELDETTEASDIESWMMDDNYYQEDMQIEAWMLDTEYYSTDSLTKQ